ncbi:protocadherin Fat 4-like [Saccoglossus kowalevskii]
MTYGITNGDPNDHFSIDRNSAVVTIKAPLDRETIDTYYLRIVATDGGGRAGDDKFGVNVNGEVFLQSNVDYDAGDRSFALQVYVNDTVGQYVVVEGSIVVDPVNEFDPEFQPTALYTPTVSENTAVGSTIVTVLASDGDMAESATTHGVVIYSIDEFACNCSEFMLDTASGAIILLQQLDYERTTSYTIPIEATDSVTTVTGTVVVTVTDVNDNAPKFTSTGYSASVNEDDATPQAVKIVVATDRDSNLNNNNVIEYSITDGNGDGFFTIGASSGEIITTGLIDYESYESFVLEVTAKDKNGGANANSDTSRVTISILPVNEYTPVFQSLPYDDATVIENAPLGKSVYQVGATDDDAAGHVHGQVRFSITSGNSAGHFVIDEMDGVISTVAELDRETRSSYDLVVTATDSSAALNDERSAEENVTITVTDVNDNTPVFVPAVYSVSISESLAVGETVLTLTTNDLDQGVNKLRDVAKLSGDADGDFTLNGNDIVIANALAYHIKDFYEISYEVTDQGSPPLSSEGLVTITVRSENDFPPVFAQATDTVTWSEDTPIGTVLYTAVATDDDTGEHGTLYYFITDGDPDVVFLMDKNTGEISLNLYLDHETVNSYDLEITAYDNEDINAADALNDVMILTIVVDDENDNRPLFGQDQYTINIDENIAIGTNIITVVATDEDAGVNSDIQYSIVAGVGQDNVEINPTTGVVSTVADIDYEMYVMYSLMIEAVDGGTPSLTGYTNIQISVNDLNDNSPQVSPSLFTVAIPEDTAADVLVTPIQVTDADSTTNGEILCVITSGDPTGQFYVDADNCDLYTSAVALDRETKDTYNLIINATDGGVPMLYDEGELTVLITDVNDNDPILNPASYSALLDEDTPVGTVVFDVDATDADINENADLTYALTSGNDLGHFTIDQDTGIITVEQLLDRETVDAYNMIVTVTDDGTPTRSNTADVTLNLNDVNDNAPTFTMATYAFVVQENVDISTSVGQLAATDPDLGANGFIAYSIESGANSDHFAINSNTGEIHTSAVIDRESISQYSLVCKARDLGSVSQFTLVDVVITVEDENDNDPVYESTLYEIFMDENSDIGTVVVTVVATDADTGANGLVTYSIPNTDDVANTYFDVDLGSGEITVKTTLDRELYETIEFLVYATDNGSPERTDTTTVIVTIGDLNDNYPTFSPSFYSSELSYLNDLGEPVLTVTATDTDVGQTVTYYFQETNDLYELDRNTGNIRVIVDRQPSVNTKYTVYVEGRDDGTPQKSSLIDATVRIDTFNPYDRLVEFYLSVSEDYFELSRDDFITSLTGIIQEDYPTGRCGVSHIIRREVGSSSTSTRRLLVTQDHELTVYVYGVRDDEADSLDGLSRSKNFVSNTYLFNKFTSDSSGTPSDELLRDPYTQWSIDQVLLHEDPNSLSWFEEWWGILILSLISLLLLALILLGIFLIYYFCCRKKKKTKSKKPVDKQPRTTTREGWGKNTAYKPSKTLLPDSNILVLPTARPGNAERKKPEANKTRQSEQELESIPKTPAPTAFDGRAVDPASGRIYEYNSKTGQRRWLKAQNYDVNVPGNVTS